MILSKREADLLLPYGATEFAGTHEELCEEVKNCYWVMDDAPLPYPVRARSMKVLENLATRLGFEIGV